jgi:hypothetical protein
MSEDLSQIEELPKGGPLEPYRQKSSFYWKKMKLFFEDIDLIQFRVSFVFTLIFKNLLYFQKFYSRRIFGKL